MRSLRLATLFVERKQEKLFRRLAETPLPFPPEEKDWAAEHFEQAARWHQLLYNHRSATRREHDPLLYERVIYYQNVSLLADRLRSACIFRTNQKEKAVLPDDSLLGWAESMAAVYADLPLLNTLFAALNSLRQPAEPAHFETFRDGLLQHPQCFSFADRRDQIHDPHTDLVCARQIEAIIRANRY